MEGPEGIGDPAASLEYGAPPRKDSPELKAFIITTDLSWSHQVAERKAAWRRSGRQQH